MVAEPLLLDVDSMYHVFDAINLLFNGTNNCLFNGLCASPGYIAVTDTCGGVICGYILTGSWVKEISPANVITMEITSASLGLI